MYIRGKTLDDLLYQTFKHVMKHGMRVNPTKGDNLELFGVILELTQPLARLSRSENKGRLFSALGELAWYLAGSNQLDFIRYYISEYQKSSDDQKTLWGAYGPRLFDRAGVNQIAQVTNLLRRKPESRRAVIQLYDAADLKVHHEDVPCTCTIQLFVRRRCLNMFVSMRSNDAYKGLPHDVFAFTMLQEIIARDLDVKLGRYKHAVGSLHLYDKKLSAAKSYMQEGWQSTDPMPSMPKGTPWPSIAVVLEAESKIRTGQTIDVDTLEIDEYWKDLIRLFQVYSLTRPGAPSANFREVVNIKKSMNSDFFDQYIRNREHKISQAKEQLSLDLNKNRKEKTGGDQ